MASKPWRSWGKTYTQGWNMAFNNNNTTYHSVAGNSNTHNFGGKSKSCKDDCCLRFNKYRCKKSGSDCQYDPKCTFCAEWNHGFHNCRKRLGKNGKRNSGGFNNGSSGGSNQGANNSPKN